MSESSTAVVVIGAGRIGQALAVLLKAQPHVTVSVWDTDTAKMPEPAVCNDLVQRSEVVLLCIPSWAMRESLLGMRECFRADAIVISLVKGLDPVSGATMSELMTELLPPNVHESCLGGPLLSGELVQGLPTTGIVGATGAVHQRLAALFAGTAVSLQHSDDTAGVSAAGVLKNIYALGLGIAQALELGDNARGWLVAQALTEMAQLMSHFQGNVSTVYGLAGVGDLIATSLSPHSRNRTVGEELIKTGRVSVQSEGLATLPLLVQRLEGQHQTLPFFSLIRRVVLEAAPPREGFTALRHKLAP